VAQTTVHFKGKEVYLLLKFYEIESSTLSTKRGQGRLSWEGKTRRYLKKLASCVKKREKKARDHDGGGGIHGRGKRERKARAMPGA